ncbi:hypothetical protein V6O07_13065, partial [Arthrospira platensis SPKY2]
SHERLSNIKYQNHLVMATKLKEFKAGVIVFHRTDLEGKYPMVICEIPEHADPENPEMTVSYLSKYGKLLQEVVTGNEVRHANGL